MSPFLTAIISAVTALFTSSVVVYLTQFLKKKADDELENKRINLKYLNPLRLYLEENHFRIDEVLKRIRNKDELTIDLLTHIDTEGISKQDPSWFNGKGCYLISTCYFTGCLFYQIKRVREDLGYLRLSGDDTKLLNLMLKVRLAFLKDVGIFYSTQTSIGNDLYLPDKERLVSYREFCNILQDPEKRVWFDRLINFYVTAGQGQKLDRLDDALAAIRELSTFLDSVVGGGASISIRYLSEGRTPSSSR